VLLDNHIHDVSDDCMDLNHSSAVIERNELHHCGDKGISIGHPIGCSGARITLTLMGEMMRKNVELGLASLCIGGGQGMAMILEAC